MIAGRSKSQSVTTHVKGEPGPFSRAELPSPFCQRGRAAIQQDTEFTTGYNRILCFPRSRLCTKCDVVV